MNRILLLLLVSALTLVALPRVGITLDPPHDYTNTIDCSNCHTPHKAADGAITKFAGNANLCESCHTVGGPASFLPFAEADQAFPSPGLPSGVSASGISHRWDSGASGHVVATGTNTSTGKVQSAGAFTGRYAKTYTITIAAQGDSGAATFNWTAVRWPGDTGGGSGSAVLSGTNILLDEGVTVTFTNGSSSPSFKSNDSWTIYLRTDINQPTDASMAARISDGKIMCSTCHNQHSQAAQPFDPGAPAYGGSGTGTGRHYQRINNDTNQMCLDCHSARNKGSLSGQTGNLTHPIGLARSIWNGLFKARADITLPLDKGSDGIAGNTDDRIQCLSCHQPHFAPTNDGSLTRLSNITSLCADCHTLADTVNGTHTNPSTGVLWPGGQYGSNFPQITDTSKRGACINCHQPHGWPDSANPSQDYPTLLVETIGNLCFTCHDSNGPSTKDVYSKFNPSPNYSTTGDAGAPIDQVHDSSLCGKCHNPHQVTATNKNTDPDTGTAYTRTYSRLASYTRDGFNKTYYSATTDLDPTNPAGAQDAGSPTIGPAVANPANTGDDTATSGGAYTGSTNQTYTVTVSTGGAPGTAQITTTSTGGDSSGPTTVTAFGTAISVGSFGVTIKFTDGGSPSSIGAATCITSCSDDTASSSGTYTGSSSGTYTLNVTTAGGVGVAKITCTSTVADPTCNSTVYTWPSPNGALFNIGSYGVRVAITDTQGTASLATGEQWQIPVTAAVPGNGVLNLNDRWTIAVTAGTCAPNCVEPDFVTFCLTCHDGTTPPGVTMPSNMLNIATEYFSRDQHGSVAGNTGTQISKGYKKMPWTTLAQFNAGQEPAYPYAAHQCTVCHDGHGSGNIFHLKDSINVAGVQMKIGGEGQCANGTSCGPWTVANGFAKSGNTTYKLPCAGGNGNPDCSQNPGGSQTFMYWGAWCSFCHTQSAHTGVTESTSCNTGHVHGGGNF